MNAIVRTGVAILCGFLASAILVLTGTVLLASTLLGSGMDTLTVAGATLPWSYLAGNLLLTLAASALGGWTASRVDPPGGWRPVIGITILVLVMSVSNQAVPRASTGAPVAWYPWALVVASGMGTLLGGFLRLQGRAVRPTEPSASVAA